MRVFYYEEGYEPILVADVLTNHSASVWDVLDAAGVDMDEFCKEQGWDDWDPAALVLSVDAPTYVVWESSEHAHWVRFYPTLEAANEAAEYAWGHLTSAEKVGRRISVHWTEHFDAYDTDHYEEPEGRKEYS